MNETTVHCKLLVSFLFQKFYFCELVSITAVCKLCTDLYRVLYGHLIAVNMCKITDTNKIVVCFWTRLNMYTQEFPQFPRA